MDYRTVLTTCAYCGCGCGLYLEALDGRLIGTLPSKTNPINEGKLCVKGWNIHEFVQHPDRITKPLIRKNGTLTEASWDEALDYTAGKLKEIKEAHGSDSIGFLASAKVTNEENYIIMKFARAAVGTNNVDHCARLWHSSTVVGLAAAFGSGAMTNSIAEIEDADCIFVTGSNTTSSHPLVATRIFRAIAKGAKVIVADPRKIQLALQADIYVRQRLGTDVALLNGIMHAILKNNWHDKAFVEERCEGFEEFKQVIDNYPPEKVSEITGVAVDDIVKIAEYYAKAEAASIVYCMGITQHTTGVDNVKSLANLAMLTGNMGKEATGVNPLRGQNNVQGACDMGGLPNVYSGYQAVNVIDNQTKFEEAWGAKLSDQIGLTIPFMLSGLSEGKVKALYAVGENPMVSDPDVGHVEKALKEAELLVVQDIFLTPTAELAHVVLPGTSFAEKDGTFTNTERRVQLVRKAIEPIGEAKADWEIIQEVSNRFGYEMNYDSAEDIMKEISTLTPSYGGITYERLEGDGLAWPCPDKDHPGTKFLHKDKFARGLGLFHAIEYQPPAEVVDDEYPFWLSTGRVHVHYHTGTMTRVSPSLHAEMPEGILEIHPEDAQRLGVGEGEKVKVASRRGEIVAKVTLTDRVDVGVVFMPFHFAETCANVLTNPAHDPTAKIPEYKVCAVKVEKAPEEGRGQ